MIEAGPNRAGIPTRCSPERQLRCSGISAGAVRIGARIRIMSWVRPRTVDLRATRRLRIIPTKSFSRWATPVPSPDSQARAAASTLTGPVLTLGRRIWRLGRLSATTSQPC